MDKIKEQNRKLACSGEPVFALRGVLALKSEGELEELRKIAHTEDVAAWLCEPETMKMLLFALPSADFELFSKAAEQPFMQEDEVVLPVHAALLHFALLQAYLVEDRLYLVVPTELRELWRDIKRTNFPRKKRLRDKVDGYAQAAVKLYGALPFALFCRMLKLRGEEAKEQEIRETLVDLADGNYFYIEEDMLLYPGLNCEEAKQYLDSRAAFPMYLPSHEKLMRLGDGDYYDVFHELELWRLELEDEMKEAGDENAAQKAMHFADSLYAVLRTELADESHRELFDYFGIAPDEDRVRKMKDYTRLWCLFGNTPQELLESVQAGTLRPPVNSPCPCGSGKKFKKCHG